MRIQASLAIPSLQLAFLLTLTIRTHQRRLSCVYILPGSLFDSPREATSYLQSDILFVLLLLGPILFPTLRRAHICNFTHQCRMSTIRAQLTVRKRAWIIVSLRQGTTILRRRRTRRI